MARKDIVNLLKVEPERNRDTLKFSRMKNIQNEDNGMARNRNSLAYNSYLDTGYIN